MNLKRVRYKQRDFSLDDIDELKQINWNLEKYGCGPTSIANVLVNVHGWFSIFLLGCGSPYMGISFLGTGSMPPPRT